MRHRYNGFDTNLIEVTVRGGVGCGKSEALEVIANALNEFYRKGSEVQIAGESCKGAIEEAETTGQSAKRSPTVFVLYEKMPGQD
jgi:ABC-type nitrate/sulfonate/bicarbonate transport system ATPase subunit